MKYEAFVDDGCGNSWVCMCRSMKRTNDRWPVAGRREDTVVKQRWVEILDN
jgi:hypothetical protein